MSAGDLRQFLGAGTRTAMLATTRADRGTATTSADPAEVRAASTRIAERYLGGADLAQRYGELNSSDGVVLVGVTAEKTISEIDITGNGSCFPTGYHGCVTAGVGTGSTVYIAGGGPVGLAAATSALLLGASVVIVGDPNEPRRVVDAAVDCIRFEAKGHAKGTEQPAAVLSQALWRSPGRPSGSASRGRM